MVASRSPSHPIPTDVVSPDFAELHAAEDRHFWFRARNHVIGEVVQSLVEDLPDGFRMLEVGCGTGNVLRVLERVCQRGEVTGVDLFEEGVRIARQRTSCRVLQADIHDLPFKTPFEMIGMFDVLEHLPDDLHVLKDLHSALAPSGRLVITVPAHAGLWSYSDVYAQHFRRYAPRDLERVLLAGGFQVEYLTQYMMPLYPLMWLGRRLAALRNRAQEEQANRERELFLRELRVVPVLNGLLTRLLKWESPLLKRGIRLPLGTSLLAVARKVDKKSIPASRCRSGGSASAKA